MTFVRYCEETKIDDYGDLKNYFYLIDDKGEQYNIDKSFESKFAVEIRNIQDFWNNRILTDVIPHIKEDGYRYSMRQEIEEEALTYISKVKSYELDFNDPYLESYIYGLVCKIAPAYLIDGRPNNVNILIQQSPEVNAFTYPNGTIVLNTGLLAALHSEDELVAILAHEIAHFILDHSIVNIIEQKEREKRAAFWSSLLTGVTAMAEGVIASKNNYYTPGVASIGVATLSTVISSRIVERLGMEFNWDQEKEADQIALQILKLLKYDPNGLATALSRIGEEALNNHRSALYIHSDTHPSLIERIDLVGQPSSPAQQNYEQTVSFAVTNAAIMKYQDKRFKQCLPLLTQNINNQVATAEDLLLKASCILYTQNAQSSNEEALELINQSKQISPNNINIYKNEIIAVTRLNQITKAIELLNEYKHCLDMLREQSQSYQSPRIWENTFSFIRSENMWTEQMLLKLQGMSKTSRQLK